MQSAIDSALSGLKAASTRVAVASDNVANVRSTAVTEVKRGREARDAGADRRPPPEQPAAGGPERPPADEPAPQFEPLDRAFVARRVIQLARAGGGTRAVAEPVEPPAVRRFDPGAPDAEADGIVARPNVALEREFSEIVKAQRAYEASLKTVETVDAMLGTFLDQEF